LELVWRGFPLGTLVQLVAQALNVQGVRSKRYGPDTNPPESTRGLSKDEHGRHNDNRWCGGVNRRYQAHIFQLACPQLGVGNADVEHTGRGRRKPQPFPQARSAREQRDDHQHHGRADHVQRRHGSGAAFPCVAGEEPLGDHVVQRGEHRAQKCQSDGDLDVGHDALSSSALRSFLKCLLFKAG